MHKYYRTKSIEESVEWAKKVQVKKAGYLLYFFITAGKGRIIKFGLQMTNEGKLIRVEAATTISEVERRTRSLVSELQKSIFIMM